jgi:hypothetical protein
MLRASSERSTSISGGGWIRSSLFMAVLAGVLAVSAFPGTARADLFPCPVASAASALPVGPSNGVTKVTAAAPAADALETATAPAEQPVCPPPAAAAAAQPNGPNPEQATVSATPEQVEQASAPVTKPVAETGALPSTPPVVEQASKPVTETAAEAVAPARAQVPAASPDEAVSSVKAAIAPIRPDPASPAVPRLEQPRPLAPVSEPLAQMVASVLATAPPTTGPLAQTTGELVATAGTALAQLPTLAPSSGALAPVRGTLAETAAALLAPGTAVSTLTPTIAQVVATGHGRPGSSAEATPTAVRSHSSWWERNPLSTSGLDAATALQAPPQAASLEDDPPLFPATVSASAAAPTGAVRALLGLAASAPTPLFAAPQAVSARAGPRGGGSARPAGLKAPAGSGGSPGFPVPLAPSAGAVSPSLAATALAALLALLLLTAPGRGSRLQLSPALSRPVVFLAPLERPG